MSETTLSTRKRNYGVDLMRIIAMFYVLVLHVLGRGGILSASPEGSAVYAVGWYMETWAYCAVNVFALISGYVAYSDAPKKTRYSNYVVLWLQAVFYNLLFTLVFLCMKGTSVVSAKDVLMSFLPVTGGSYWYLTAYTGLFLLMPVLNWGMAKITERTAKQLFVLLICAFSAYEIFVKRFVFNNGYSFAWLVVLYVLGQIVKKCDLGKSIRPWLACIGVAVCCTLAWVWKLYGVPFSLLGANVGKGFLVSYTSPLIVGASLFYLIGFSRLKIREGKAFAKVIGFAAPGAFAAYLINCQKYVWDVWMKGTFAFAAGKGVWVVIGVTVGFSLAFVAAAILLDRLRMLLFDLMRIRKNLDRFFAWLEKLPDRWRERRAKRRAPEQENDTGDANAQ